MPAGHIFAAMVAGALDHGRRRRNWRYGKSLAGDAAKVAFASIAP